MTKQCCMTPYKVTLPMSCYLAVPSCAVATDTSISLWLTQLHCYTLTQQLSVRLSSFFVIVKPMLSYRQKLTQYDHQSLDRALLFVHPPFCCSDWRSGTSTTLSLFLSYSCLNVSRTVRLPPPCSRHTKSRKANRSAMPCTQIEPGSLRCLL